MRLRPGTVDVLSEMEVRGIHAAALRILDETGMWIENDSILHHLEGAGGRVDYAAQRVRYAPALVERFLADSGKLDWSTVTPTATASSGVYFGMYHDPESDGLVPWNEERLARYFALARALPNVDSCGMLGCPTGVPARLEPLYEKLYCWKYGAHDSGTIHLDELCPYLYDLFQLRAQQVGRSLQDVFRGTAYLVPPLKLGRHEAYQFLYFYERGLQVHLGDMYAMGATSPVTLAGSVALSLAEQLALGIMQRAFFGGTGFGLGSSISPLDMRTMLYPYGRPEMAYTNMMMAQMARFYGLPFGGHAGLSEAKLPSCEAGAQKALTAITTLLAAGHVHMDAGLLSTDEVCSPVQMILDDEFCGSLKHLCKQFGAGDEELAVDLIGLLGPGGNYMATDHTAAHFRSEHWEPRVWSRRTLSGWLERREGLDVDRAREVYRAMLPDLDTTPRLTEQEQSDIQALIDRAGRDLGWQE
ncbi:MAG: trimethylamine methyltransferase family protein [Anaerolineae bacterium]